VYQPRQPTQPPCACNLQITKAQGPPLISRSTVNHIKISQALSKSTLVFSMIKLTSQAHTPLGRSMQVVTMSIRLLAHKTSKVYHQSSMKLRRISMLQIFVSLSSKALREDISGPRILKIKKIIPLVFQMLSAILLEKLLIPQSQ
jgi:hypothetical protein